VSRDILDRLNEEKMKARFRKDTTLLSRLHEASREIEYFRWAIERLALTEEGNVLSALREFAKLTKSGERIGAAHPLANPEPIVRKGDIDAQRKG